ncbi:OsmC family protein [Neomegalonema sp.]|uniref:OsmC family protein n=1 Tax=Neomegalonema sp. TaxID=2039713 RepID=UPI002602CCD5|nr:OsmC family protein [Neomegalonema sp.]MDD2868415.1 OsmC family protein [Neomegalonema sp.]
MSDLQDYLVQKREALLERRAAVAAGGLGVTPFTAQARAEGRSGVRRIRIRDHQIVSDSPPSFAGYDLGPGSPEILLGSLASCLTHTWLIHAADQRLPLESVEAEARGRLDARAGTPGFEDVPVHPHEISFTVRVLSSASPEAVAAVEAAVRKFCPILNLLGRAVEIRGELIHETPDSVRSDVA